MLKLAQIFSDHMVLQREKQTAVWGDANAGATVTVSIQGQSVSVTADENGKWQAILPPLTASKTELLTVKTDEDEINIKDVAVGEVWLAGGQSNMEFPLLYEKHWEEELSSVNPNLRFYDVPEICFEGQENCFDYSHVGIWRKAQGDDLLYFSAVAYYFQKELEADLSVPVGIVGCNWGGTRSSAWMKQETVKRVGEPWIKLYEDSIEGLDMDTYQKEQKVNPMNDRGNPNMDPFSAFIMPKTPSMEELAQFFSTLGGPSEEEHTDAGVEKSFQAYQDIVEPKTKPGCLYEHMLMKIAPYTVRGVLWYQGESDDEPGLQALYKDMLTALIADWREAWHDDTLPFLLVQLPGWGSWMVLKNLDYATIRRCQEEVADSVNDVYLASISDVGEELDIHPKDKRTVGYRLALLARKHVYGEELLADAPVADKVERNGKEITVSFKNAGDFLTVKGDTVEALAVTENGENLAYTTEIKGNRLIILLDREPEETVKIEFGQGTWYAVNLFNAAEIPAIPFCAMC